MDAAKPQPNNCRICKQELELREDRWVCLHCLLIWHGDTFEAIPVDSRRTPPLDMFFMS